MLRRLASSLPLLRAAALRAVEAAAADLPLMERAGLAAAELAAKLCTDREAAILVVAGPGNNGGDACVAARHLRHRFAAVDLVFAGTAGALPADAGQALAAFIADGGTVLQAVPDRHRWGLVIDGLFGIGLTRPPAGTFAELIATMNSLAMTSCCPLLALDCPSGLDADTGRVPGAAVAATHTLSFIAAKPGLLTADGPDHCGIVQIAALGLDVRARLAASPDDSENVGMSVGRDLFAEHLKQRPHNSHKGSFGSAGIIGGTAGMTGAVLLAGRAALKLGAGRVFIGSIGPCPAVDPVQPELMLRDVSGCLAAPLSALACGPGMGVDAAAGAALSRALAAPLSLVIDADGLNLIAGDDEFRVALATRKAPTILTPHPAEAARLLDCDVAAIQRDRIAAARQLAAAFRAWVALKGAGTVVAAPDGRWWINASGSPLLATAGSGDVLTGHVVALLAQGWPAEAAVLASVHLHGCAGETLATELGGAIGGTAGEVADAARRVFNQWVYGG